MLHSLIALGLCGAMLAGNSSALAEDGEESQSAAQAAGIALTIQRQVSEVYLSFTAEDRHRKPLSDVRRDQVSVFDDGQAVKELTSFRQNSELPLRLALLVDCSDSMRKNFAKERRAAHAFAQQLLRPGLDSLLLVDFAGQSTTADVSGGPHLVEAKMKTLEAAGHTALYDAIYEASTTLWMNREERQPVRRVMILLSDGEDNDSRHGRAEAIAMAQRAEIVIYAITAHSRRYEYQGDAILRRMAEATGGRAFVLSSFDLVEKVFTQIEADLRTQYSVTFRPGPGKTCGFHTLRVGHRDRKVQIRAREGYYLCER
jgi:Ca-activated chloride channel family protein